MRGHFAGCQASLIDSVVSLHIYDVYEGDKFSYSVLESVELRRRSSEDKGRSLDTRRSLRESDKLEGAQMTRQMGRFVITSRTFREREKRHHMLPY